MPGRRFRLLLPVPLLLAALGAEGLLRLQHRRTRARLEAAVPTRSVCTRPAGDPELVYEVTPGLCGANSRGFMDREHAVPKPSGVRRLVVLGDSVAQGHELAPEDAFPARLARLLDAGRPAPRTEAVLLTRSGYSIGQELRVLEVEAPRYEPDLVIWSYVLNDPAHPLYHNPNGEMGLYHYAPRSHLAHFAARRLFLLRERWRARGCRDEYHARLHCLYGREVGERLARVGEWSRAQRVPVVFVIHPVFEKGGRFDAYTLADVHADLAGMAQAAGLTVVDLLDAYRGREAAALKLPDLPDWYDPWHPNAEGHRLAAELLAARLRAAGLAGP